MRLINYYFLGSELLVTQMDNSGQTDVFDTKIHPFKPQVIFDRGSIILFSDE